MSIVCEKRISKLHMLILPRPGPIGGHDDAERIAIRVDPPITGNINHVGINIYDVDVLVGILDVRTGR